MNEPRILIVDDDQAVVHSLELLLRQAGFATASAGNAAGTLACLSEPGLKLVLQDMNFSRQTTGQEGLELLTAIKQRRPDVPVILITAWGSIELAVKGMKAGASDFITKPWRNDYLVQTVRTILNLAAEESAGPPAEQSREQLDQRYDFAGILGRDSSFLRILELAGRVAATDAPVLITGESGTGKEVVANAIHRNSTRRDGPFIKVNLGAVPPTLFESEMFGHVKGAFTDARRDRPGRFELADGGTILLDEIGELDLRSQVKLLRVLQDRTVEPLGSSTTRELDVRVICATNRDLREAVADGSFREDLLYRINLITLNLPPLAERPADVPVLAAHFLARAAAAFGKPDLARTVEPEVYPWLARQAWPGNVRQLEQFLARAVLLAATARLDVASFKRVLEMDKSDADAGLLPPVGAMTMDEVEKAMIEKSLQHHEGNISRAAESLGLSRAALYRRLEKYGIPT
jgi:two-component system NtrC family response regulator